MFLKLITIMTTLAVGAFFSMNTHAQTGIPKITSNGSSTSLTAITAELDKKYLKKYDSWEQLSTDEATIDGIYSTNCKRLQASFCRRLDTSIMNIEGEHSRLRKIRDRAVKACRSAGGQFASGTRLNDGINLFLKENSLHIARTDYIKKKYHGVCSIDGVNDTLFVAMAYVKNIYRPDGTHDGRAFTQKGKVFIYLADMKAKASMFNTYSTTAQNTADIYRACMSRPLEAADTTTVGLVVEIKGRLAQVQRSTGVKWMKISDLRKHSSDCR